MSKKEQQVAVVSGGSKGLGAALAKELLGQGYAVVTFSRKRTAAVDQLEKMGGSSFHWTELDMADFRGVEKYINKTVADLGRVDALINNAGVMVTGSLPLIRYEQVNQMISVNLEGAIHLTRVCSRFMVHQRGGNVVNISTVNAVKGHTGVAVYAATKAGLDAMTRCLAKDLGPRGIRVNSVAPGYFESDLTADVTEKMKESITRKTPLARLGTVEDMLGAVRFLLSKESSFITGQVLVVDGGLTC